MKWTLPTEGWFKCNIDGSSKDNLGPSSGVFCIWNHEGDLEAATSSHFGFLTGLEVKTKAMLRGLEFCVAHNYLPINMEIDSLILKNKIDSIWEVPWKISIEIKRMWSLVEHNQVVVVHTLREGNKVVDLLANKFSFCRYIRSKLRFNSWFIRWRQIYYWIR